MKKIHKLTSFLTAATMALSMSVSFSAAAVMQPEEGKKAYADLQARARAFRVDDAVLNQKYNNAKTRIQNNTGTFDIFSDRPYGDEGINYGDYQFIRDTINELYKKDGFNKKSFPLSEVADYNKVKCDVDGDGELSYYDYCCMLRYIQEQIGLTDDYTDLIRKQENLRLGFMGGEGAVRLKKIVSDEENITIPSEICCKVKLKDENGKLVDSWCILPVLEIKENAFSKCPNMKKLTIRNYIQPEWFMRPEEFDCEEQLFSGKLRAIENGGTVADCTYIDIKDGAFKGCSNLETVNFQENVNFSQELFKGTKFYDSDNCYQADNGICYVKSSDGRALAACGIYDKSKVLAERNGILNFDIEDGTTTITSNLRTVFYNLDKSKKISLNIPDSVRYIHNDAFSSGETFDYSSGRKIKVDCYSIKWVNGRSFDELCADYDAQKVDPDKLNEDDRKRWIPTLDELLKRNNGSFKGTQFMADPVKEIINEQVSVINANKNIKTERDKIEAACKFIFEQAEYSTYVDGIDEFSLFPNDLYNTVDEARANNYAATNVFLSHYTMCESYSYAVSLMLDALGVRNCTMGCAGHAYNFVYIDEQWQIVDMSVYGAYDRNYALYTGSDNMQPEDKAFIRNGMTISTYTDKDYYGPRYDFTPVQPKNIYGVSGQGYYPGASIAGSSKLAVFNENGISDNLISEDVRFNIVGMSDGQKCLTIALPSGDIPEPIRNDIAAGRLKAFNGNGIVAINGADYYFENNRVVTGPCWRNIDGKKCYIKEDNTLAGNEDIDILVNGEQVKFRFNVDHTAYTGIWYDKDSLCYYDGYNGKVKNAYRYVDGKRYYFDNEGRMVHGKGWFSAIGSTFYFINDNTIACDDELEIPMNGKTETFRFNSNGTLFIGGDMLDGVARYFGLSGINMQEEEGWYVGDDNNYYYFKDTGVVALYEDYEISPGHIFRFKDNGTLLWGFDKKDGILRYFDYSDGMLQKDKEFYVLDGKTYYFKEKGILACNEKYDINVNGTEYTYWFNGDGAMITGWHSDGKNYYLLASNGRMVKNSYIEWGGAYYHLDGNGIMAADTDVEWKNGIKLHANSEGALDLSVLNQYQLNEFKNEVAAY